MRRVPIGKLINGDRLGRDVYAGAESLPLLRAGVRISDSYRRSLERAGVLAVWVDDKLSEGIEPQEVLEESTKQKARVALRDAFGDVTFSMSRGGALSSRSLEAITEVAELIVQDIGRNVHAALALNDLASADDYTMKHSLAVTTLGLSLGLRTMHQYGWVDAQGKKRFDGIEGRLVALGVGLLLHDIGKLAVPQEILRKPGPLTEAEWAAVKQHPLTGVKILKNADEISPLSRTVVRSHHERWDGSGYPDGQSGADIHLFPRIAAVADVFDALTSDRFYRPAMPPNEGYDFVLERGGIDFDPDVVRVFKTSVAPYPQGSRVLLSDGHGGLVEKVHPEAVKCPVVRIIMDPAGELIAPRVIDLSKTPELTVVSTRFDLPVTAAA
jgi:HD-GYP domain-containing protein (c-di-GMP phosphodiesterase class II)